MFKNCLFIVLTFFYSTVLFGQIDNRLFFGEKKVIYSEILGGERQYWVHLPTDYESSSVNYPVLFITDGDEHFFLASGISEFMSSQFIVPEFIVVAIFHPNRNHDLTPTHSSTFLNGIENEAAKASGGGVDFLHFIEKELIKQLEHDYRTSPFRLLAGHSLGGLFCTYAYLTRNNLFNGFIAMDPALNWDNNVCEKMLDTINVNAMDFNNKLYISSAHNAPKGKSDKGPLRTSQVSIVKALDKKNINCKFEVFEQESHLTVPYRSIYAGLSYFFPDYYIFHDPNFREDIQFVLEFYENLSKRYKIQIVPPENLVEMLGKYFLFDKNEFDKAIGFLKLNTINYPESYKSFNYLAKAYTSSGDRENAILCYKKALALNPDDTEIQKKLLQLESK